MGKPIGIDLGTTYSAIAGWKETGLYVGPECYNFPLEGQNYLASKIYFPNLGDRSDVIVGKGAIKHSLTNPDTFFSAFKRGMDDNAPYERTDGSITPVELSSMLLRFMLKDTVMSVEGNDFVPDGVVVSVPYYFTEPPCQNTCTALTKSLKEIYSDDLAYNDNINMRTLPEPVAAGLDYAFTEMPTNKDIKEKILIFDLGGGTFDVTIYELKNTLSTKNLEFTILSTDGDARLGGEDFDASIRKFVLDKNGITQEMTQNPIYKRQMAALYVEVTETKIALSGASEYSLIMAPFFDQDELDFNISQQNISSILHGELGLGIDYMSRIDDIVERCLKNAKLTEKGIDKVVLVGGSSKIPCIRKELENRFGKEKLFQSAKPDETVARGACIWTAYLLDKQNINTPGYIRHLDNWNNIVVKEKTAHNLGIITANGVDTIITSNQFTPVSGTRSYTPSSLSSDGTKAEIDPLIIMQGNDIIGTIPFPIIFTHGRGRQDISIKISLVAEPTSVKVIINVPQGNEDGSDILSTGQIKIS